MSSLWTPGGEHRVPRDEPGKPGARPAPEPPAPERPPGGTAEDEEAARAAMEQLANLEQELVSVPAADVVANHCYGLFELAAVHLRQHPPHFSEAQLAIDALGAVVEHLGERLGDAAGALTEGLTQIRLAYVQLSQAPPEGEVRP